MPLANQGGSNSISPKDACGFHGTAWLAADIYSVGDSGSYTFTITPQQYKTCAGQAYGEFDVALASYRGASQTLSNYSAFGYPYTTDVKTISLGKLVTLSSDSILLNIFSGAAWRLREKKEPSSPYPKEVPP
jgi:hypothetical protein